MSECVVLYKDVLNDKFAGVVAVPFIEKPNTFKLDRVRMNEMLGSKEGVFNKDEGLILEAVRYRSVLNRGEVESSFCATAEDAMKKLKDRIADRLDKIYGDTDRYELIKTLVNEHEMTGEAIDGVRTAS